MKLLLLSNSGYPLYKWCLKELSDFIGGNPVTFVSAATVYNQKDYYKKAKGSLSGIELIHLELDKEPERLIEETRVFLVGGGNTYHLLHELHKYNLIGTIREKVLAGAKYIGISAGANIAGPTILTTNDWNIIGSTKFEALNLVPFNISPHYIDPHDKTIFSGESREDRIFEHFVFHDHPVIALKEKTLLKVDKSDVLVGGEGTAKLFSKRKKPRTFQVGEKIAGAIWKGR